MEEVLGFMKKKLDLPIGSKGDSHRLDKVNFSHPRVQTSSATTRVQLETIADKFNYVMPHIQHLMETNCDTSEWHIARIPHRSKKRCHAI